MDLEDPTPSRRHVLNLGGSIGVVALAGCIGGGNTEFQVVDNPLEGVIEIEFNGLSKISSEEANGIKADLTLEHVGGSPNSVQIAIGAGFFDSEGTQLGRSLYGIRPYNITEGESMEVSKSTDGVTDPSKVSLVKVGVQQR